MNYIALKRTNINSPQPEQPGFLPLLIVHVQVQLNFNPFKLIFLQLTLYLAYKKML